MRLYWESFLNLGNIHEQIVNAEVAFILELYGTATPADVVPGKLNDVPKSLTNCLGISISSLIQLSV